MNQSHDQPEDSPPTWWVWWDQLLEEWFYTDISLDETPGLRDQLIVEGTQIHEVAAHSGVEAIENIAPGYREGRHNPIERPVNKPATKH